jgi:mannose-6-phosphate isomerase-like protein (cupin superfamily)
VKAKQQKPIVVPMGEGKRLNVLGETIICRVSSGDTNGAYSVNEEVTPPQGGPPLHVHHREDEMFYVLEGECKVQCGDQTFTANKGFLAILPRNIPHGFQNVGTTPSKVLVTIMPGGFERFFEEVSQMPADGPSDMKKVIAIAQKYELELLPQSHGS